MFWVIFDTSTKRDYYRDVHNILALPSGATIRYDYSERHLSAGAVAAAKSSDAVGSRVLLAYAQTKNFKKGDADPSGAIPFGNGIWIGTRMAILRHIQSAVGRYYFDLELRGYPAPDEASFGNILRDLASQNEVPFEKWIAVSDRDAEFRALEMGDPAANWSAVVDRLGNFPSQFTGDTFWRVASVAAGSDRRPIAPILQAGPTTPEIGQGVEAFFPVDELEVLGLQIQSRMPEAGEEPRGKEAAAARQVHLEAVSGGPVAGFNGRDLQIRRYASEWIDAEVAGSDRIDTQPCDVKLKTLPESEGYPIGPELSLKFHVSKKGWRSYWSILSGIAAAACVAVGAGILKDSIPSGIILLVLGAFLGIVTYYLWSGRVRLPGPK